MSKVSVGVLAALLLYPTVSQPLEVQGNSIVLSPDEVTACVTGGGCIVVPKTVVWDYLAKELEKSKKAIEASCSKKTV